MRKELTMSDMNFTPEQEKAIKDAGSDILVAASAGSGKTRVLVERVINKLVNDIGIDELLILTFTDAAAREMKERIQSGLRNLIDQEKNQQKKQYYLQQMMRLNVADISTIDAFCLKLVKNYYYLVDIDPEFRLLTDDTERQLLRESVWDDLREELYGKNDPVFEQLTINFSNDRSDDGLFELIESLYEFANVTPDPKKWLESLADNYHLEDNDLSNSKLYQQQLLPLIKERLEYCLSQLKKAEQIFEDLDKQGEQNAIEHLKIYQVNASRVEEILKASDTVSYDTLSNLLRTLKFDPLSRKGIKDPQAKELKDQAKKINANVKSELEDLKLNYFMTDEKTMVKIFNESEKLTKKAVKVVLTFMKRYQAEKASRRAFEFSDIEHLAFKILSQTKDETVKELLKERYKEIMVDEYQDTNQLQEAILKTISQNNMFMVGDVKQSIYGFRLADPTLFLDKYERFADEADPNERIILAENFRSMKNVIQTTNFIFSQIMDKRFGEMDYDKDAKLVYGKLYPKDNPGGSTDVLIYTDENNDSGQSKLRFESVEGIGPDFMINTKKEGQVAMVAHKIKQLFDENYQVYDQKTKGMRPLKFDDIAVLSETRANHLLLAEELKRLELPYYVQKAQNYFQTTELQIMLALLAIIDNPYQDIELAAVLRSPIVSLKENELAYLRINDRSGDYYQAVRKFYEDQTNENKEPFVQALYAKIQTFMQDLDHFRDLARQNELSELILAIYDKTGFLDYVGGMPGGSQRQANLHALYERATEYEKGSFKGLFQFINFIKKMEEKNTDLSEALVNSGEDKINIMTIHGSKGLEFPIVFLMDADHNFNMMDTRKKYVINEHALAIDYYDQKTHITTPTLLMPLIKQQVKQKMLAEKMRLLYVALTRAKEKLFITAGYNERKKVLENMAKNDGQDLLLDDMLRNKVSCFMDWILPTIGRKKEIAKEYDLDLVNTPELNELLADIQVSFYEKSDFVTENKEKAFDLLAWDATQMTPSEKIEDDSQIKLADQILDGKYRHEKATKTTAYQAVSELKRLFDDPDLSQMTPIKTTTEAKREVLDLALPRFMTEEVKVSPAAIGTAIHLLFQEVGLTKMPTLSELEALLEAKVLDQVITKEVAEEIDLTKILAFYESNLGQELLKYHDSVKREVPFSMILPAGQVFSELDESLKDPILVHGIMDGYFVTDNGEVILFDYKTDHVLDEESSLKKVKDRYFGQLMLYQTALEKILNKKVDHKYLYLVNIGKAIEL